MSAIFKMASEMLVDLDKYEVGKQYCVFDTDLLRFKPDYTKLSIADFDDYTKIAWIICSWGSVKLRDCDCSIESNRLKKIFHLRCFTRYSHTYDKHRDFYSDSKNYKYFENLFSLLNARYGLLQKKEIGKIKEEYDSDIVTDISKYDENRWVQARHVIYALIEYIETMGNIGTEVHFGDHETRKHYYGIMCSLSPFSVFANAGLLKT